jgi:hypothetical protein
VVVFYGEFLMVKRSLLLITTVGAFSLSGCATPPKLATSLKLLVVAPGQGEGKPVRRVNASDCGFRLFGIGKYPSFRAAADRSGVRYFKNASMEQVINIGFYGDQFECKRISGEGFK